MLCIGLDPQQANLPLELQSQANGYFAFCKAIVDATHDTVCAYKPQAAHFAALGYEDQLAQVIAYIKTFAQEFEDEELEESRFGNYLNYNVMMNQSVRECARAST